MRIFLRNLTGKPLTGLSFLIATATIIYSVYEIATGSPYLKGLNYIDSTTIVMIGVLWIRIIQSTRKANDLQSLSLALTATISFVFTYEAIYKYSFYLVPWVIPPSELRELTIQIGLSLLVLVGFAYKAFSFSRTSKVLVVAFAAAWAFWVIVGFPQIFNLAGIYPSLFRINLSYLQVYLINRGTKLLLMLVFFFLPSGETRE